MAYTKHRPLEARSVMSLSFEPTPSRRALSIPTKLAFLFPVFALTKGLVFGLNIVYSACNKTPRKKLAKMSMVLLLQDAVVLQKHPVLVSKHPVLLLKYIDLLLEVFVHLQKQFIFVLVRFELVRGLG